MATVKVKRTAGQGNIVNMVRKTEKMDVLVGNPGSGERGSKTLRLIKRDGSFLRIERAAALKAGLKPGAYVNIEALVTERENVRGAKTFMVNEVFAAAETIEPFVPEEFVVEYVTEPASGMPVAGLA